MTTADEAGVLSSLLADNDATLQMAVILGTILVILTGLVFIQTTNPNSAFKAKSTIADAKAQPAAQGMPNSNEEPLLPAGEATPAPVSIPADSLSEENNQLETVKLSDQDEATPPADATDGDTNPKDDPELWKPHPPTEECPVCMVPLPLKKSKVRYWPCCGKLLCSACGEEHDRALNVTNMKRSKKKLPPIEFTCAFCRIPLHKNDSELISRYEERADKGDTQAMTNLALKFQDGDNGLRKNDDKALELIRRAADLGSAEAIGRLGKWASDERLRLIPGGTDAKECYEDSIKKGNVQSRYNLAAVLYREGHIDLAIKHWHLAAAAGHDDSMEWLWKCFHKGRLSKPDLEKALRAHKAASDEMKSEERGRCDAFKKALAENDERLTLIYKVYYLGYINAKELKKVLNAHRAGDWGAVQTLLGPIASKARTHG
jgi:TPR repeat protein